MKEHGCQANFTDEDVLDLSEHFVLVIYVVVCFNDCMHTSNSNAPSCNVPLTPAPLFPRSLTRPDPSTPDIQ